MLVIKSIVDKFIFEHTYIIIDPSAYLSIMKVVVFLEYVRCLKSAAML